METKTPVQNQLESLRIHEDAIKKGIAQHKAQPDVDRRAKVIAMEEKSLAEVQAEIKRLEGPTAKAK